MKKKDNNAKVFMLEEILLESGDIDSNMPNFDDVGEVKTYSRSLGAFSSVRKAENMIKAWIKRTDDWEELLLGFQLIELVVDEGFCGCYDDVCEFKTMRTYLPDGSLNCMSNCDSTCEVKFKGRSSPVKCDDGDFVIIFHGVSATVGLVVGLPMTKEQWKAQLSPSVVGDYTDDSYTVVEIGCGHSHPFSPTVFPVSYKLPGVLKRKLAKENKRYLSGKI